MDKKLTNPQNMIPTKQTNIPYSTNCYWQHNKTRTYLVTNCPGFVAVDNVITSLYTLIKIHY